MPLAGMREVFKMHTKFLLWVWEKCTKYTLDPCGECMMLIKSLWWVCGQYTKYTPVVGVGELQNAHTKSMQLVREKHTKYTKSLWWVWEKCNKTIIEYLWCVWG